MDLLQVYDSSGNGTSSEDDDDDNDGDRVLVHDDGQVEADRVGVGVGKGANDNHASIGKQSQAPMTNTQNDSRRMLPVPAANDDTDLDTYRNRDGGTNTNKRQSTLTRTSNRLSPPFDSQKKRSKCMKTPDGRGGGCDRKRNVFVRSQPHVRGNWAGHVFIDICKSSSIQFKECIDATITRLQQQHQQGHKRRRRPNNSIVNNKTVDPNMSVTVETATVPSSVVGQDVEEENDDVCVVDDNEDEDGDDGTWVVHEELHVSLSRPFYVQESNIQSFISALKERVQYQPTFVMRVLVPKHQTTSTTTTGSSEDDDDDDNIGSNDLIRFLTNDTQTRVFAAWDIMSSSHLLALVAHVDSVLQRYKQPVYYQPPHFHVSLASKKAITIPALPKGTATKNELQQRRTNRNDEKNNDATDVQSTAPKETTTIAATSCHLKTQQMCFLMPVKEIRVTFGTTKAYTIPLLQLQES